MRNFGQIRSYGETAEEIKQRRLQAIANYESQVGGGSEGFQTTRYNEIDESQQYSEGDIRDCIGIVLKLAQRVVDLGYQGGAIEPTRIEATKLLARGENVYPVSDFIEKMRELEGFGSYMTAGVSPEEHYCMLAVQWYEHYMAKGEDPPYLKVNQVKELEASWWEKEGKEPVEVKPTDVNAWEKLKKKEEEEEKEWYEKPSGIGLIAGGVILFGGGLLLLGGKKK